MDLESFAEFITDSNECFNINLVRPSSGAGKPQRILDEPFHPDFTYPIYGEEQKIIGYSNLDIYLDFRANDLKPSLDVRYKKKIAIPKELADKVVEPKEGLKDFLPSYVFDPANTPKSIGSDPTSNSWKPPGKLILSYTLHGKQFEVWSASLADPAAKELFRNMQILIPLFIEGGTCQELDDQDWTIERWTLFLLYEVTALTKDPSTSPYTIAGFATSYRLWVFPTFDIMRATKSLPSPPASNGDSASYSLPPLSQDPETYLYTDAFNPLEAPSRERISQFVILPPYQGQSHGGKLYGTIFEMFMKMPNIYEITVEDPNEAFDDMRDYCDIIYLRSRPAFQALSLPSTLPPESLRKDANIPRELILGSDADLDALRHETKIVPRQFNRMLELHLFSTIPRAHRTRARITRKEKSSNENDRKYYFWRLALKDRLYRQHEDLLQNVEVEERIEKIEMTVQSVEQDYERLLEGVEKRVNWTPDMDDADDTDGAENGVASSSMSRSKRKRVVVDEDEDDEWEDAESVASSKKVKI
ncbi:histone acetyltransferase type B [Zopfia rhizophila CBS 207.26]|uniref:Histone acetyltransferase type B catalytic subunit n=1 Tax=Zopfia rhizophila CBS 207.26 TaxID=1314779 RepID=A0A6A6DRX7_9PEZI|nr:histone acetyltransferase type B [Zopfia rhizophila CBS 207.26]